MDNKGTNTTPTISPLKRFGVPLAALAVGMFLGSGWINSYNGHGPEAGFAGLILMFGLFPVLALVSALVSAFGRGTKWGGYFATASVFFVGMIIGPMFFH